MSTLELITNASATSDSQYPIVLNPDPILHQLKPQELNDDASFIKRVQGWSISKTDTEVINLAQNFHNNLKIKLKNPNSFTKDEFIALLNSYLEKNSETVGISIGFPSKFDLYAYAKVGLQKLGFLMGGAVLGLVLEGCIVFEIWDVLEGLIVGGLVDGGCGSGLVRKLVEKNRADLVCLCVKHVSNLEVSDVLAVLKFFMNPGRDGYGSMAFVRKEWERRAGAAIDMSVGQKSSFAKDAAVLLVMAHDEFTASELCLHYLVASENVDDVVFAACVGKLNGAEIMGFVRYLKKWLVKYRKFPQACSVPKDSSMHGLKGLESVPSLEHVTKCFGLVIDEHFSSLVMHPEFREEVESVQLVVSSLAAEARLCCSLANLCAGLKN